jgi:hypothetical protein
METERVKVFKRVPKWELYLKKISPKELGLWWDKHLLMSGGYEEVDYFFWYLTEDNPEPTVAIGYKELQLE